MHPIKRVVHNTAVKVLGHQKAEDARLHFKNSLQDLSKLISALSPNVPGKDDPGLLLVECKKLKVELGIARIGFLVNETSNVEGFAALGLAEQEIELLTFDLFLSAWGKRKGIPIRFADQAALTSQDLILVDTAAADEEFLNALRACAQLDRTIPVLALVRSQVASRSTQGTFWYGGDTKTYAYFFNYFSSFYQIKESFQLHMKVAGPDKKTIQKTIWIHPDCHYRIGGEDFNLPTDKARLYHFEYKAYHPRFRFTSNRIRFGFDIVTPESVAALHSLELAGQANVLHRFHDSTDLAESPVFTFRKKKPDPVTAKLLFHIEGATPLEVRVPVTSEGGPIRKLSPREVLLKERPGFSGSYMVEALFEDTIEQLEVWSNDLTRSQSRKIEGNHVISAAKVQSLPEKRLSSADIEAVSELADISFVQYALPLFNKGADGIRMDSEVSFHTQSEQHNSEWSFDLKLIADGNRLVATRLVTQKLAGLPVNLNKLFVEELQKEAPGDYVVLVEPRLDKSFDSIKSYGATNPAFRLINRHSNDSDSVELQGGFAVNLPGYLSPFPTGYSGRYSNKNRTNIISRLVCDSKFDTHSAIVYRSHGSAPGDPQRVKFELLFADGGAKSLELVVQPNSMIVMSTSELKKRLGVVDEAAGNFYWLRVTSASCSLTGYSIIEDRTAGSVGLQHFWGA
jgi:hypothetical protein